MDNYKKLKAVQGLIMSLDEQIYRLDQYKEPVSQENLLKEESRIVNNYFVNIKKFINEE